MTKKSNKDGFYIVYEMISILDRIAKEDVYLTYFAAQNYSYKSNIKKMCEEMKEKISRYLYRDLLFMMDAEFSVIDGLMHCMEDIKILKNIESFLEWIDEGNFILSLQKLYERSKKGIKKSKQVDLEDLIYNEKELKIRLQFVFKALYENVFAEREQEMKELRQEVIQQIQAFIEKGKPVIYSYFKEIGEESYEHFEVIGVYESLLEIERQENKKKLAALKIVADDTRFEILRLLSKRPWYGAELAQQLQLSTATISYHLNSLMDIKMIKIEKVQNRQYYALDTLKVEEIFQGVLSQIV